ncbi:hypothetical protein PAKAF_05930 [Pseudomonas aeruginosa PAK]|nr:hypothetical protein PAKAF_05930 [Pseudomonas aeruginosa PAK]
MTRQSALATGPEASDWWRFGSGDEPARVVLCRWAFACGVEKTCRRTARNGRGRAGEPRVSVRAGRRAGPASLRPAAWQPAEEPLDTESTHAPDIHRAVTGVAFPGRLYPDGHAARGLCPQPVEGPFRRGSDSLLRYAAEHGAHRRRLAGGDAVVHRHQLFPL